MKKKSKIFWTSLLLALLLLVVSRFTRLPFFGVYQEDAIPDEVAMVVSFEKEMLKTPPRQEVWQIFIPEPLRKDLGDFEKIFGKTIPLPDKQRLIAAVQPTRTSGIDVLFIVDNCRHLELEDILQDGEGMQVRESIFKNHVVYTVKSGGHEFALTKYRNLLLFGHHAYLLENAVSQLKSPSTSLCKDDDFKRVIKRSRPGEWHFMFNLSQLSARFAPLIEPGKLESVAGGGKVGHWLSFEFPANSGLVEWRGAFTPAHGNELLEANRRSEDLPFKNVFKALPDNLGSFVWLAISNFHPHAAKGIWREFFSAWAGNEIAIASGEPLENDDYEQFILLKTKNEKKAEAGLEAFTKRAGEIVHYDYQMFKVRQIIGAEVTEMLGLGQSMTNPFVTVLGEYVLFGNSKAGMERWMDKFIAGQTFSKSVGFLQMLRTLPVNAHGFLYLESGKTWQQIASFLDDRLEASLSGNPMRFNHLAATMQQKGNICELTVITPKATKKEEQPANILWRTPLAAAAAFTPFIFQNSRNGELAVFIQDTGNQIYLISRSGRVLWRRKLDEPILSDIFQIDLHNNEEAQMAFSTASKIFVINSSGDDVDGFPLELQIPATNGVTVIDFFKSHDYQFFIACENGLAYGFDEKGNPVEGWRPHEGVGIVRLPMLHFQANGMDFLVLMDGTGKMQVYQKNGSSRFPVKNFGATFQRPPAYQSLKNSSRIVACDTTGTAYITNLSGDDFKLSLKVGQNSNVRFAFADVTGDERKDYLVMSGNELGVYYYSGNAFKKSFIHQFTSSQDEVFAVQWQGGNKAFAGTAGKAKQQIHLFDGEGRLLPQFPLAGTTPFHILDLSGDGKAVLVVGNGESVYAYALGEKGH